MTKAIRGCSQTELVRAYLIGALRGDEAASLQSHLAGCEHCQREKDSFWPLVESLTAWPIDVVRPPRPLWDRVASRVAAESGQAPLPRSPLPHAEEDWNEVAPGIAVKLLATDAQRARVSMLVRLQPGVDYPAHTHAGVEELHLLAGELWIDDRKLLPGDYNRAEPGTADQRVYSATGCTCVLITSPEDRLG